LSGSAARASAGDATAAHDSSKQVAMRVLEMR